MRPGNRAELHILQDVVQLFPLPTLRVHTHDLNLAPVRAAAVGRQTADSPYLNKVHTRNKKVKLLELEALYCMVRSDPVIVRKLSYLPVL